MMKTFNHVGRELPDIPTEYHDGKRYYVTAQGNKYPSITTLLGNLSKQGIIEWRRRVGETEANKISRQASSRGTRVHNICESYIQNQVGILEGELPDAIEMFNSIVPLLDRIDNIHVVEGALFSDDLGVAGRTDLIGEFDKKLSVIDYKTSRKRKTWEMCHGYFMQGTFYAHAWEEMTGEKIQGIVIIMVSDDGNLAVFEDNPTKYNKKLQSIVEEFHDGKMQTL